MNPIKNKKEENYLSVIKMDSFQFYLVTSHSRGVKFLMALKI